MASPDKSALTPESVWLDAPLHPIDRYLYTTHSLSRYLSIECIV